MSAVNREAHERELALSIGMLVVGAVGAIVFGILVAAGILPGGSFGTIAAIGSAGLALLGARRLSAVRKDVHARTNDEASQESVAAPDLSPSVAYGPPLLITGAIACGFGYLVGGMALAVLLGGGVVLLVFHGLRAPPLAPTSQSPILRRVRRWTRRLR